MHTHYAYALCIRKAVLKSWKGMPCHVIYFEDLKDSLKVIMDSILNFISVEIENFDDRMQCLQENSEGNFHREEYGSTGSSLQFLIAYGMQLI